MVEMIALDDIPLPAQLIHKGETFHVDEKYAKVFRAMGKAKNKTASYETKIVLPDDGEKQSSTRRQYRRRDMTAER